MSKITPETTIQKSAYGFATNAKKCVHNGFVWSEEKSCFVMRDGSKTTVEFKPGKGWFVNINWN